MSTATERLFVTRPAPGWAGRAAALFRAWRQRRKARQELTHLSARDLADAGISSAAVEYELRQPAWRPLLRLRDIGPAADPDRTLY